jgi:peptidoglycan/LPS O-acetylase OafA/YrhL
VTTPEETPALEHRGYPGLNALRALGALMVLTTHVGFDTGRILSGWTGSALARMDFGVAIFFVLSGFLLGRPFLLNGALGRPTSMRTYFWKRGLRILPLYWLVVVAALVFQTGNGYVTPAMWARNFTLTQLYHPDLLPQGLTQMWSLCTEVAFYVVLPFLAILLVSRRRRDGRRLSSVWIYSVLGVLMVGGVAWQARVATVPGADGHFAQWLPGYLPWFAVGLALATASVCEQLGRDAALGVRVCRRMAADPLGCWLAAALVFGLACTPLAGPRTLLAQTSWEAGVKCVLYAVSSGLLVLPLVFGHLQEHPIRQLCNHPVPFFLGEISYGIFCIHLLVLNGVQQQDGLTLFTGHFLEVWCLTVAITVLLATLSYYVVEKPFLRLKRIRLGGAPPPEARDDTGTTAAIDATSSS